MADMTTGAFLPLSVSFSFALCLSLCLSPPPAPRISIGRRLPSGRAPTQAPQAHALPDEHAARPPSCFAVPCSLRPLPTSRWVRVSVSRAGAHPVWISSTACWDRGIVEAIHPRYWREGGES